MNSAPSRSVDSTLGSRSGGDTTQTAAVVRAPRYFRFMLIGAVFGIAAAFVLTVAFPETGLYTTSQVFGFLLLGTVVAGLAAGGTLALLVDRCAHRRVRTVSVERTRGERDAHEN